MCPLRTCAASWQRRARRASSGQACHHAGQRCGQAHPPSSRHAGGRGRSSRDRGCCCRPGACRPRRSNGPQRRNCSRTCGQRPSLPVTRRVAGPKAAQMLVDQHVAGVPSITKMNPSSALSAWDKDVRRPSVTRTWWMPSDWKPKYRPKPASRPIFSSEPSVGSFNRFKILPAQDFRRPGHSAASFSVASISAAFLSTSSTMWSIMPSFDRVWSCLPAM